ncbi:MAG: hypothetical protein JWQ97_2857 [Phenylobacterium sp.]|nr:hypothetical protein [Phenylobacterium sp.]
MEATSPASRAAERTATLPPMSPPAVGADEMTECVLFMAGMFSLGQLVAGRLARRGVPGAAADEG